jgi:hypothetical protein
VAHESAKLLLEQAKTIEDRTKAVRIAMCSGMSLQEIEEYLDMLDRRRGGVGNERNSPGGGGRKR